MKKLTSIFVVIFALFQFATVTRAGGGLISLSANPPVSLHPGEWFMVTADVKTDFIKAKCSYCNITFHFVDPKDSDVISPESVITDENGKASAKMTSYVLGNRLVYVKVNMPDGNTLSSSQLVLGYNESYIQLDMVYPQNDQTLDLEGDYLFKVKPVTGASGYLFGFFQNGQMVYENYRDSKSLSSNGEFALWQSNPYHSNFQEGQVSVVIRALVDNKWTDSKKINIYLKARNPYSSPTPTKTPVATPNQQITPPTITGTPIIIQDSSASAELQKRVDELENKLAESEQKQSALEQKINDLIEWIKSLFPFFN